MRSIWRGLRKIRSHVSVAGKRRSADEAEAQEEEGFACLADLSGPFDRRPLASEVRFFAISPRLSDVSYPRFSTWSNRGEIGLVNGPGR